MKDLVDEYLFHKNEEVEIVLKLIRLINKIKEHIKENIADIEFMEKEYSKDYLNNHIIEVEYNDIKYLVKLLENIK